MIDSLQTFDVAINEPTKKKRISLKVKELSKSNEDLGDELALVAKKFKKLFQRNAKDYFKNKQMRRSFTGYKKKKDFSKEPLIYYKCKGRGHIAEDCGNKKYKYKPKDKSIVPT